MSLRALLLVLMVGASACDADAPGPADAGLADAPTADGATADAPAADATSADGAFIGCDDPSDCTDSVCCVTGPGSGACVAGEGACEGLTLCTSATECAVSNGCCPQGFCAGAGCD